MRVQDYNEIRSNRPGIVFNLKVSFYCFSAFFGVLKDKEGFLCLLLFFYLCFFLFHIILFLLIYYKIIFGEVSSLTCICMRVCRYS